MYKIACLLTILVSCTGVLPYTVDTNRIANGIVAANLQFPYAISLQQVSQATAVTRGHRCGGVLITLQHALTAASCTYNIVNGVQASINPGEYRIFAGASLLTNDTTAERIRNIANFTLHPQHIGSPAYLNDIAIITFVTPFANSTVVPLSLPSTTFAPADFTLCTVTGWGAVDTLGTPSTQLRYASKYVYNQNLCTTVFNGFTNLPNVHSSMICAASYDILSVGCVGDIGNAMVCDNQLTGILFITNNCVPTSYPELYTRVSNYTTWIRSVTGAASTFQPGAITMALFTILQIICSKIIR